MQTIRRVLYFIAIFAVSIGMSFGISQRARAVTINITYDSSVSTAPAGFTTTVNSVASQLDSLFTNPIDININVGWGEVDGQALQANAIGESIGLYYNNAPYTTVAHDLTLTDSAASNSSVAHQAAQNIPTTSPIVNSLSITSAEAKAIGAVSNSTATDGYVGFDSSYSYTFNSTTSIAPGTYDFTGLVFHELTEIMGRTGMLPSTCTSSTGSSYSCIAQTPLDLFRYSAPGTLDTNSPGSSNYFSVNGGQTVINTFNTVSGADYGDWAGASANAFNAFIGSTGTVQPFTTGDLEELNALGYQTSATAYTTVAAENSSSVPEPSSTLFLIIGALLCSLGLVRRDNPLQAKFESLPA